MKILYLKHFFFGHFDSCDHYELSFYKKKEEKKKTAQRFMN